jgi:hypothetical protein
MSARDYLSLIVSGIVLCSLFFTACVSTYIGDVAYSGGALSLSISHTGEPSEGFVQVTVYRIQDNRQEENAVLFEPLALRQGENSVNIPSKLEPGQYKLYIYLIQNGERKTAAIRDIVVT